MEFNANFLNRRNLECVVKFFIKKLFMKSFLIVKTSAIGDVIQAFPVLEYLRGRFPEARIDWVVEKGCYGLVSAHPFLNHVYSVDTKRWRKSLARRDTIAEIRDFYRMFSKHEYDAVFDLQGNTKSALITMMAKGRDKVGFSFKSVPEKPNVLATTKRFHVPSNCNVRLRYLALVQSYFKDDSRYGAQGIVLNIDQAEKERMEAILSHHGLMNKDIYMVSFGSRWANKRLTEETLREFLTLIDRQFQPAFIFIWGDGEERKIAEGLQSQFVGRSLAVGNLSLPLWQALMSKVKLVIATDSAGLHLAGSVGTPSFSIFGPSSASVYKPMGEQHHAFQGTCPYALRFEKRCPKLRTCETGACIRGIAAKDLFARFMGLITAIADRN
jgi:heptosyltransferase I